MDEQPNAPAISVNVPPFCLRSDLCAATAVSSKSHASCCLFRNTLLTFIISRIPALRNLRKSSRFFPAVSSAFPNARLQIR